MSQQQGFSLANKSAIQIASKIWRVRPCGAPLFPLLPTDALDFAYPAPTTGGGGGYWSRRWTKEERWRIFEWKRQRAEARNPDKRECHLHIYFVSEPMNYNTWGDWVLEFGICLMIRIHTHSNIWNEQHNLISRSFTQWTVWVRSFAARFFSGYIRLTYYFDPSLFLSYKHSETKL